MRQHLYFGKDLFSSYTIDQRPNPDSYRLHTHNYAEILLFLQGDAVFHVEGTSYPIAPGDVLITRPMEAHYIEVSPEAPYERMVINFDMALIEQLEPGSTLLQPFLQREAGRQNLYQGQEFAGSDAITYLQALRNHANNRLASISYVLLFLTELRRVFDSREDTAATQASLEHQILRYIENRISRPITLDTLCQKYFISRAQLCRRFKKVTGTSVAKYIATKRLLSAQQMILQGKKPSHIYELCGFGDYSAFYRAYTRYFGYSPKEEGEHPPTLENYKYIIG